MKKKKDENPNYANETLNKVLEDQEDLPSFIVPNQDDKDSKEHLGEIMKEDRVRSRLEDVRKENEETKKRDQKLKKQQEEIEKEKRKEKRWKIPKAIGSFFLSLISIKTYINLFLSIEDLLFILFIDGLLIFSLFSLLFISYIIITADKYSNISVLWFKLAGAVLISVICIVAQYNSPKPNQMNKSDSEGE